MGLGLSSSANLDSSEFAYTLLRGINCYLYARQQGEDLSAFRVGDAKAAALGERRYRAGGPSGGAERS